MGKFKPFRHSFPNLLSILVFLLLPACSKIEFAYKGADIAILSVADQYFDLSSEQKKKTQALIQKELRALLKEQVPKFNPYLKDFILLTKKKNLTRKELSAYFQTGQDLFLGTLAQLEPSITEFALMITPEQFQHYERKVLSDMKDSEEQLRTEEAQRKELRKRSEGWFDFIGLDLNQDQDKLFDEYLKQAHYPFDLERKNRAAITRQFLVAAKSPGTLKTFLHQILSNPLKFRDLEYKQAYEQYQKRDEEFELNLLRSLTEEQKAKIEKGLGDLIEQLKDLRSKEEKLH